MFLAFAGVVLINKPWDTSNSSGEYSTNSILIGSLFAFSGAVTGGFAALCMRIMREGIHYSISPFWFSSGCTFMSPMVHMI